VAPGIQLRAESYQPETTVSGQAIRHKLDRDLFFVKSVVKRLEAKTSDKFDVYDPETRRVLLECREPDLGLLTKTARLLGGVHDRGTAFNLVAKIPGTNQQVFRITRGSASLTLGGPVTQIFDHEDKIIGKMKRKNLAWGMKFVLFRQKDEQALVLQIKSWFRRCKLLIGGTEVAQFTRRWEAGHAAWFRHGRFDYAIAFSPEFPRHSPVRHLLLAVALAWHRIRV
jgi:hypothetical protein